VNDSFGVGESGSVLADARQLIQENRNAEGLQEYLSAFDYGMSHESFATARFAAVDAIALLAPRYPSARAALLDRFDKIGSELERSAKENAPLGDAALVALFVRMGIRLGEEARVVRTYSFVKSSLPIQSELRRDLWTRIEEHLVTERRYAEAVAEHEVSLAAIHYYVDALGSVKLDERLRPNIEFTVEHEGGTHYEALLGAGRSSEADALADDLIRFAPSAHTFATLIRHARRAGAFDVAARLKAKAYALLPIGDRVVVDVASGS
jgi:hypothetical protein